MEALKVWCTGELWGHFLNENRKVWESQRDTATCVLRMLSTDPCLTGMGSPVVDLPSLRRLPLLLNPWGSQGRCLSQAEDTRETGPLGNHSWVGGDVCELQETFQESLALTLQKWFQGAEREETHPYFLCDVATTLYANHIRTLPERNLQASLSWSPEWNSSKLKAVKEEGKISYYQVGCILEIGWH